mgnify:FL=1
MQMFLGAASRIACNPNNITRQNSLPLWYRDLKQVVIADGEAAVFNVTYFPETLSYPTFRILQ